MAENDGAEREEAATPKRLQEARDKGQIARSKELTTALLLMAAATALFSFSSSVGSDLSSLAQKAFSPDRRHIFSPSQMISALEELVGEAFSAVAPLFFVLFFIGLISPLLLGGLSISLKAIAPKANRMSFAKGIKRIFGRNALIELVKALAKISVVFVVAYWVITSNFPSLTQLGQGHVSSGIKQAMDLVTGTFFLISFSLLLIALIDVPYQIWNHAKELKMSKQEVKDEYKETEGKPEVKGKVRQKQRELSQQRMMEAVPEADVVVTNPEHYSVALKYDVLQSGAPIVVAKGVDLIAMQIRKVAIANDVNIVPMPPLARALYHTTEINQEVPQGLYMAVAQVLAFAFQLKSHQEGKGPKPEKMSRIDLPKDFNY